MRRGHVLNAIMASAGPHAQLISHAEAPWYSATFSGTQHTFQLAWERSGGSGHTEEIPAFWPPEDFVIPGKVIAEIVVNNTAVEIVPRLRVTAEVGMLILDRA